MRTIAALFVDPKGIYSTMPDVDCWGEDRDARLYTGPHPVIAHPPCARWCRLAGMVEKQFGHKVGDDGGCFAAALDAVRRYGGVLEHPAYSKAWAAHGLTKPRTGGGWQRADLLGGWSCYVEQGRYGHVMKKATWLYAYGVELPSLLWGSVHDADVKASMSWCGKWRGDKRAPRADDNRRRITKRETRATPQAFADVLVEMARKAAPRSNQRDRGA
jgi:hypothetical protein